MTKRGIRDKTKFLAKLVSVNRKPCAFCHREVDDEIIYGKLYAIGDIQCHYFCVLLSCCLVQKGKDSEGLFGFLYPDILAEVERSKKHRCSYCSKEGANLGCFVSQCRKQFHLPCGREKNAVSLFYGNYKSFCKQHAPKQKITANVMAKVRQRMQANKKTNKMAPAIKTIQDVDDDESHKAETVCVICYEEVVCGPTPDTFWPPCCARDAWFHRSCVQRMSLSAGMHYLKCPLCNDKDNFYQAVIGQGFYVPDRDALWELEQNAFSGIYEREVRCGLDSCICPEGRHHDTDEGPWDINLCLLCGSSGAHKACLLEAGCCESRYACATCAPAAPSDLDQLATSIENVILSEQARSSSSSRRPVMPSRMSLRRTKQRQAYYKSRTGGGRSFRHREAANLKEPLKAMVRCFTAAKISSGSSSQNYSTLDEPNSEEPSNTTSSRQELNLKTPKRNSQSNSVLKVIENKLFSPVKLIEQALRDKVKKNLVLEPSVVENVRMRFRKPKPLSEKKKILDGILEDLLRNLIKENSKVKDPIRTWCSPKKDSVVEVQEKVKEEDSVSSEQKVQEIKQEAGVDCPQTNTDWPDGSMMERVPYRRPQPNNNHSGVVVFLRPTPDFTGTPKRNSQSNSVLKEIENKLFSPVKLIEQALRDKVKKNLVLEPSVVENVRMRFRKPKPLSEKKKIVDGILEDLLRNIIKENSKVKDSIRTWCSPKKDSVVEVQQKVKEEDSVSSEQKVQEIEQEAGVDCPQTNTDWPDGSMPTPDFTGTSLDIKTEITNEKSSINEQEEIECIILDDNDSNDDTNKSNFGNKSSDVCPVDNTNVIKSEDGILDADESSNSTFQLPPEFVAEDSDNSLPIFDTPKKLKTVNIKHDTSMEISENNDVINIDLVEIENGQDIDEKIDSVKDKCSLKFSPTDKECLESNKMDIDLESFKNLYLNEVDRDFKCSFGHKHNETTNKSIQLRTALDFAIDTTGKSGDRKRKVKKQARKRKMPGIVLKYEGFDDSKRRRKTETEVSIQNDSMRVKISLKKKKFKFKIMQAKKNKTPKGLKQYVLKYSEGTSEIIGKPEKEVTPIKRKYVKSEKSPDNLIQTSIQSFFKGKSPMD